MVFVWHSKKSSKKMQKDEKVWSFHELFKGLGAKVKR